jgi:hypothetical protein
MASPLLPSLTTLVFCTRTQARTKHNQGCVLCFQSVGLRTQYHPPGAENKKVYENHLEDPHSPSWDLQQGGRLSHHTGIRRGAHIQGVLQTKP